MRAKPTYKTARVADVRTPTVTARGLIASASVQG
jgi:hypothetical protein